MRVSGVLRRSAAEGRLGGSPSFRRPPIDAQTAALEACAGSADRALPGSRDAPAEPPHAFAAPKRSFASTHPPAPSSSHEHPHPLHRQQLPQPNGSRHPAIPRLASARVLCRHETRRARASRGRGRPEGACVNMEKWTRETVEAIKPESADLVFSVCEAKAEDVQKIQPSSQGRGAARATRRPGAALLQTPWSSGRACAAVRRRAKTSCAGLIETFRAEKASGSLRRLSRPPHPPFHHPAHSLIVMSRRGLRTVGTRRFGNKAVCFPGEVEKAWVPPRLKQLGTGITAPSCRG